MALPCQKNSLRWCGARPTRKLQPVKAELISRGRALLPKSLTVDRNMLGEGSFGQVFMGSWRSATGDTKVVLKRVKAKVEGALAMGQMELLLNAYAGKVAKAHCAEFLGYCEVAAEEATSRLTSGLWLVWKYEGSRTLAYYLRRRDTLRALASDMEIPEEAVVATAIKQLCEGLAAFHAAGLVHRDVKPQNIIFADDVKRLKLIDLGACADLRTGTNYVPDESILDPNYCPPEQYVLPTDSPHLAKSMLRLAISPMLWAQHKPDRFDTWSAGVCMLQLAVPSMRQERGLRNFNTIFSTKCSYDLAVWRTMSYIPAREFEVLDADDGAGWDLVRMLLRPRSIKTLQDGTVVFVNDNSQQRLSAGEALRHRFMKQAAEPGSIFIESGATSSGSYSGSSSSSGSGPAQRSTGARGGLRVPAAAAAGSSGQSSSGSGGSNALRRGPAGRQCTAAGSGQKSQGQGQGSAATGAGSQSGSFEAAVGLWRNLTGKLFDLEANIVMTASATELQTGLVKQLKKKVVKGQASADALRQEEVKLSGMEQQLGTLQDDFNKTASAVGNVLSFLGFGGQSQGSAPAGATGPRSSSSGSSGSSGSKQALVDSSQAGRVSKPPSTPTKLAPQPPPKSGAGGLWASVQDRMSSLEQQFSNQVAATERQSLEVRRLKQELSRGVVEEAAVARAEELLQRMERRLSKLDQEVATQRQTTPGFFSMFGSFGATPPAEAPPPAAAPAPEPARQGAPSSSPAATAASSAPAPAAAGSKPTAPTGFGGLLSRMFGGGRSGSQKTNAVSATAPATSAIPEQQQQQQQQLLGGSQRAAPAPRGRTAPVPVRGASVEVIAAQTSNPAVAAAQVGAGQAMVQGAGSLLATSLKFTGLAAKVALGMASSLKADAERMMKQMEAEAAAQRQRKALEQAFMRMLRTKQPPMSSTTSFTEVERQFGQDARFLAVASEERRLLVAAYVDALLQAELRQAAASEAKLRERMMETLSPESSWEDVQLLLAQDPAFKAVSDPQVRKGLFEEVLQCLRDDEQGAVLTARNEQAFQEMLEDLDSPAISPDTAWPLIKPQVWKDSRYLAVPESRRRSLFATVQAARAAEAAALAQAQRAQAEAQAQSLAALLRESQAAQEQEREKAQAAENSLIEQLRADQTRLRDAYQKMESKLREMEAALQAKERSTGSIITARRPGTTPLPAPRHGPTPRPTALFRVGPTPAVARDMSQQPAVAPPPPGSGLGGAAGLPSLPASSRSPGANSASSSTNGQDDPSNTSSVTSSVSSITGSNSSSRMTMNNALSTGRLTGESSLTSPASYQQARPLASQPPAAAPGPHFPVQGAGASTVLLQAVQAPAPLAPVAVAAGGAAQASQLAGGQAGRPSELMASLAAAGVSCQRLEDGTLVFSFDRAAVPRTSPSPSPGATAPPPSPH